MNMKQLKEISFKDRKAIFDRLEQVASQANLTEEERAQVCSPSFKESIWNFNTIH